MVFLYRCGYNNSQFLYSRGACASGLDNVPAIVRVDYHERPGVSAYRFHFPHHILIARCGELHCHHHPVTCPGHDVVPFAVFRLGTIRDGLLVVASFPPPRSSSGDDVDRYCRPGNQLLLAYWIDGRGTSSGFEWRRQSIAVPAPFLVPWPPRGLRFDSAGYRHCD